MLYYQSMSTERRLFYEATPAVGPMNRSIGASLRRGFLAPYIAFGDEQGVWITEVQRRSIVTGVIPMGLILPEYIAAVPATLQTHRTEFTDFLNAIKVKENRNELPSGSFNKATHEVIHGTFSPDEYGFDVS